MKTRQLVIEIMEIKNKKIIAFELDDISKDDAIVILNRCLFRLLHSYDDYMEIKSNSS